MTKLTAIQSQNAEAERQTIKSTGLDAMHAEHERALAAEAQAIIRRQASGVAEVKRGLDEGLAGVKEREAERVRTLTGPLGTK